MPLIAIRADGETPTCRLPNRCLQDTLSDGLKTAGPVIVMVHGYRFSPNAAFRCPHRHILSMTPKECWKARSWPRDLGFGNGSVREGLALAFGWHATGTIWQAYQEAERAGHALARLINDIAKIAPNRPVHLLGHSLGARVILSALHDVRSDNVARIILLNGAEYGRTAEAALDTPAGRRVEVFNVTTRENDIFEFLFERAIAPTVRSDRCMAQGLQNRDQVLTIEIDRRQTLLSLRALGFSIARPQRRICHWSVYLRPGVFDLYRALLRRPQDTQMAHLRAALPKHQAPRWTRILGLSDLEAWVTGSSWTGSWSRRSQRAGIAP